MTPARTTQSPDTLTGAQYLDALRALPLPMAQELWTCECHRYDYSHPHRPGLFLHWSFGNTKLRKDGILSFNLPAFTSADGSTVCGNAGECAGYCYARQGNYRRPSVKRAREHSLRFLRRNTLAQFIDCATSDLHSLHPRWKMVRIHDSGDFIAAMAHEYFLAWCAIARQCPHLEFYGYTKMVSLLNANRARMSSNMHLIQSYGGKEDALIDTRYAHSWVFTDDATREAHGYIDGTTSDAPAYTRETKIGLIYHGTTSLNAPQVRFMGKKLALLR